MSQGLQSSKRKKGLSVGILWTGMSTAILFAVLFLFTHQELFIAVAFALSIAMIIFGAATKQLFKTRDQEQINR